MELFAHLGSLFTMLNEDTIKNRCHWFNDETEKNRIDLIERIMTPKGVQKHETLTVYYCYCPALLLVSSFCGSGIH
jgi:hypothetical protein